VYLSADGAEMFIGVSRAELHADASRRSAEASRYNFRGTSLERRSAKASRYDFRGTSLARRSAKASRYTFRTT